MNNFLFSILLTVTAGLFISANAKAQTEEKIFWEENLEFSWDLFKEKKSSYSYFKALTFSGIMYDVEVVNDVVEINISSYFIYGKSWVMKGYKKPYLLEHEKMHFHIAEVYKRKLDALCERYRVNHKVFVNKGFDKALQRDFDRIFNEMEAYQNKYDQETEHGTKREAQKRWEAKLKKELGI